LVGRPACVPGDQRQCGGRQHQDQRHRDEHFYQREAVVDRALMTHGALLATIDVSNASSRTRAALARRFRTSLTTGETRTCNTSTFAGSSGSALIDQRRT
jgi:hypothetical protein